MGDYKKLIYILSSMTDKPIKLIREPDSLPHSVRTEFRKPNKIEIRQHIITILREMKYDKILTTQQYRSAKGNIKKAIQNVHNLIWKRDFKRHEELLLWVDTEQEYTEFTIIQTFDRGVVGGNLGMYSFR